MHYNQQQFTKVTDLLQEIDPMGTAMIFIGSVSDDQTQIHFNFLSRLETEESLDVLSDFIDHMREHLEPEDTMPVTQKPNLNIVTE